MLPTVCRCCGRRISKRVHDNPNICLECSEAGSVPATAAAKHQSDPFWKTRFPMKKVLQGILLMAGLIVLAGFTIRVQAQSISSVTVTGSTLTI